VNSGFDSNEKGAVCGTIHNESADLRADDDPKRASHSSSALLPAYLPALRAARHSGLCVFQCARWCSTEQYAVVLYLIPSVLETNLAAARALLDKTFVLPAQSISSMETINREKTIKWKKTGQKTHTYDLL
jgi:hypothetical protein